MNFQHVKEPNKKPLYYKRIIWLGIRADKPDVNKFLNQNSTTTIKDELVSVGSYPCLFTWNTPEGEIRYAEATKTHR